MLHRRKTAPITVAADDHGCADGDACQALGDQKSPSNAKLAEVDRAIHRVRAAAYGRMGSRNLRKLFDVFDVE